MTLYTVLATLCQALPRPLSPFMAETIYQNLVRQVDESRAGVRAPVRLPRGGREPHRQRAGGRDGARARGRQPGPRLRATPQTSRSASPLPPCTSRARPLPEEMAALVADELNVKAVRFVDGRARTSPPTRSSRRCAPSARATASCWARSASTWPRPTATRSSTSWTRRKNYEFDLEGTHVSLAREDMLIAPAQRPGFVAQSEGDFTVVLDANLTDELRRGGLPARGHLQGADHAQGGGL